jgi:hypothetical protein
MPADLDQFGREYSHGTVIGWKGLVKLRHMAADGRCFLNQVNLKTGNGKIEGGLNTGDSSTHHHYIPEIIIHKAFTKQLNFFFKQQFFFHFRSPHPIF